MIAVLLGFSIGFLMCIPVGPINIWVINTQIRKSEKEALSIAAGGSIMDFCYFIVVLSGLSMISFSEGVMSFVKVGGLFLIFILGIKELINKKINIETNRGYEKFTKRGMISFMCLGVAIYISNPTLLITMTSLATFIKGLGLFEMNKVNVGIISFSLALGSFSWFLLLVKFIKRHEQIIREKYLLLFSRTSGALMIIFSLIMTCKIYWRIE